MDLSRRSMLKFTAAGVVGMTGAATRAGAQTTSPAVCLRGRLRAVDHRRGPAATAVPPNWRDRLRPPRKTQNSCRSGFWSWTKVQ